MIHYAQLASVNRRVKELVKNYLLILKYSQQKIEKESMNANEEKKLGGLKAI